MTAEEEDPRRALFAHLEATIREVEAGTGEEDPEMRAKLEELRSALAAPPASSAAGGAASGGGRAAGGRVAGPDEEALAARVAQLERELEEVEAEVEELAGSDEAARDMLSKGAAVLEFLGEQQGLGATGAEQQQGPGGR